MLENIVGQKIDHKPTVSVVVPTLNEAKNLPLVLPYIPRDIVGEVLLVDGRSKDNTVAVAKQLMPDIHVVYETKKGKGAALRCGYRAASGDIIVVLDADGSNDPREIPRFVNALIEGADFVKGSRFAPTGGTTDMPRLRKFGNWGFVKLVNSLFSTAFTDLAYGYHAFWRHCLNYLNLESVDGFEVDASIYLQAVRNKLRVVEVPSFEGFRFYGEGKLQTFPDGWRVLKTILREWRASQQIPDHEPQVGFRSYGRKPGVYNPGAVPVTGHNGNGNGSNADEKPAERTCYGLDQFFLQHMPDVSSHHGISVISTIIVSIMEELGASSGSLVIFDDYGGVVGGYLVFGRNIIPVNEGELYETLHSGITSWAIENQRAAVVKSTRSDPRWLQRPWEAMEGISRTALVAPCVIHGKVVSVLTLARPDDRPFTEKDLHRLHQIPIRI